MKQIGKRGQGGCETITSNQKLGSNGRQNRGLEQKAWKNQNTIWAVAPYYALYWNLEFSIEKITQS